MTCRHIAIRFVSKLYHFHKQLRAMLFPAFCIVMIMIVENFSP